MAIPVPLAATATRWSSPARLPYELVRAGFEVSVLAPSDALVTKSRYVAAVTVLPDRATPLHWAQLLAANVREHPPRLIVPRRYRASADDNVRRGAAGRPGKRATRAAPWVDSRVAG